MTEILFQSTSNISVDLSIPEHPTIVADDSSSVIKFRHLQFSC